MERSTRRELQLLEAMQRNGLPVEGVAVSIEDSPQVVLQFEANADPKLMHQALALAEQFDWSSEAVDAREIEGQAARLRSDPVYLAMTQLLADQVAPLRAAVNLPPISIPDMEAVSATAIAGRIGDQVAVADQSEVGLAAEGAPDIKAGP